MNYLMSCAYCSGFKKIDLFLCNYCWDTLFSMKSRIYLPSKDFCKITVRSLFFWRLDQSPLLNATLMILKQSPKEVWFDPFVRWISQDVPAMGPCIFIPVPSSKTENKYDHAYRFSLQQGHYWNQPIENILEWAYKPGPLKGVSRQERQKIKMTCKNKNLVKNQKVIIIDDVITTGSTAQAAWEALGKPPRAELWTIACRE